MRWSAATAVAAFVLILIGVGAAFFVGRAIPQDWSTFVPNLVSEALLATAVSAFFAIVIWRWQSSADHRQAVREAEAGWRVMREMIRVALPSSQAREADSDDWAHDWRQISPMFSTPLLLDILHWAALLPERDDLAAAHELVVVGPQLELSARRLDDALWKETKTIRGNAELDPEFITAEWRSVRLLAQEPSQPQYVSDTVDRVTSNLASEIDLYRAAVANVNEIVNRFGLLTA